MLPGNCTRVYSRLMTPCQTDFVYDLIHIKIPANQQLRNVFLLAVNVSHCCVDFSSLCFLLLFNVRVVSSVSVFILVICF